MTIDPVYIGTAAHERRLEIPGGAHQALRTAVDAYLRGKAAFERGDDSSAARREYAAALWQSADYVENATAESHAFVGLPHLHTGSGLVPRPVTQVEAVAFFDIARRVDTIPAQAAAWESACQWELARVGAPQDVPYIVHESYRVQAGQTFQHQRGRWLAVDKPVVFMSADGTPHIADSHGTWQAVDEVEPLLVFNEAGQMWYSSRESGRLPAVVNSDIVVTDGAGKVHATVRSGERPVVGAVSLLPAKARQVGPPTHPADIRELPTVWSPNNEQQRPG